MTSRPLEEMIAQLFMLGFEGSQPTPQLTKFIQAGLGGIIFFRDNFQSFKTATQVTDLLSQLQFQRPGSFPTLFMGVDQEGGQVERLPHSIFPSLITPGAIGLSKEPQKLAQTTYTIMAEHLAKLGFNFNFAPTLDVNLEAKNPIIGVRAFGECAKDIWPLGKIAIDCLWQAGVIPVAKHFPGHGHGTVDSHFSLPHLVYNAQEQATFQAAITHGVPAVLVSHGFYPQLQSKEYEYEQPASASDTVIQGLLREQLGFNGLIVSDDMCMGAITQDKDPVEAAIASLKAGIDLLVYKQSTELEWQIYQGVITAVQSGHLPVERIQAAYKRILSLKERLSEKQALQQQYPDPSAADPSDWSMDYIVQKSLPVAEAGLTSLKQDGTFVLPLAAEKHWLFIHPDRGTIINYSFDQLTSPELPELLAAAGLKNMESHAYPLLSKDNPTEISIPKWKQVAYDGIIFVSFNPLLQPIQQQWYQALKADFADAPFLVVSAGTAYDELTFQTLQNHWALCSYRPPSMLALTQALTH